MQYSTMSKKYIWFTFQYGSIQMFQKLHYHEIKNHLHSNMVLFKWMYERYVSNNQEFTFQYGSIQINNKLKELLNEIEFTFQYGSIQIHVSKAWYYRDKHLHSNMVLFKSNAYEVRFLQLTIYIPIWFYSN